MLVDAMNRVSLSGAPGLEISRTSRRVTPVVLPSPEVEDMTPSYRWEVFVDRVIVVPCMGKEVVSGNANLEGYRQRRAKT